MSRASSTIVTFLARHRFAKFSTEKRSPSVDRITGDRIEDVPHKRSSRNGIEDDRNLTGLYLACAKTLKRPLRRAPPHFFGRSELITMTRNGKPVTPLLRAVGFRYGRCNDVPAGSLVISRET